MTLIKDNVVKTTTSERVIRRLLAAGFREKATDGEEGDALALLTIRQLKEQLDKRGVGYKQNMRKSELVILLQKERADNGK